MEFRNFKTDSLIEKINVRKLVQILKEIKLVKDAFPSIKVSVKSNYSKIKLSKKLKYAYFAEIELEYDEMNWIIESHSFPETSNVLKIGSSISLKSAAEGFLLMINNLQNYYESLYILDINCTVLEPLNKSMCINWRLIKYSQFAFLKIEFIDIMDVNNFKVTFFGKDHIIKELNETYNNSSNDDYGDDDIYQKLCRKLKILEFPYTQKDDETECAICLCHQNEENEAPIVCCENPKCTQLFHGSCISQHLNINSYKILSVAVGECPFCKMKISANFAGFIKQNKTVIDSMTDTLVEKMEII